ncbi:LLM class F420-dependent oxidoreductase [Sphaerisporangium corydalis]|uniref:LLM class F420-dependent oxidoreductase n=1 Tax=Sphaerisporangium corydalis TaxID=1441875 RepID=A0ABV9E4M6_9ACTN|nr:LLM class F420-dependent oxidoreductase [Sphaerisporangium corydalis]
MRLGVTMFTTDQAMPVADLARAAEERGLTSLYVPEHTHIPISRRTPPAAGQDVLPEEYKRTLDPLVTLAYAAAVTERLTVGTGIMLAAQRDPIVTAKAIATLDHLSGGRFVLGVGFGWNVEEMESHGVTYATRRDVVREHVLAMKELWNRDVAGFQGRHVSFEPSWSWPKPVAGPPVLIGGAAGPKLFAHVAEYADGWIPIGGKGVKDALPALREACEKAGRDPAAIKVIPFGTVPSAGKLEYYAGLGIEEVVCSLPSAPAATILPILDDYSSFL